VTVFSASPSQPEAGKRPLLFGELTGDLLHPAKKVRQEDSRRDMEAYEGGRISEMRESQNHDQVSELSFFCAKQKSTDRRGCSQTVNALQRRQSVSPEPSSLFDSSVIDTSQATTITEPDVVAVTAAAAAAASTLGPIPRPVTRPRLTREEARQVGSISPSYTLSSVMNKQTRFHPPSSHDIR
jgi:hypothetical protein